MDPSTILPLELMTNVLLTAQAIWPKKKQIAGWIRLAAVCSTWRGIILGTPAFWTEVDPPYDVNFVREAVERSASLVIKSCTIDFELYPAIAAPILAHSRRLSLLCMTPSDQASLSALADFSFDMIRYLALFCPSHPTRLVARDLHPSLHQVTTLTLRGVEIPMPTLSAFRALQRLSMEFNQDSSIYSIPFSSFLDVLQGLHLRELVLDSRFNNSPPPSSAPFLALPDLYLLHFDGLVSDAAVFLSTLCTVRLRRFQIFVSEYTPDDSLAVTFLSHVHRFTVAMNAPTVRKIFCGTFSSQPDNTLVEIAHRPHSNRYFLFTLQAYQRTIVRHLTLVLAHLHLGRLTVLDLNAYSLDENHVPSHLVDDLHDWLALLRLVPSLRELHVKSSGILLDGLPPALSYTSDERECPCPQLYIISFSEGGFYRHQCSLWHSHLLGRMPEYAIDTLRFHKWTFPRYPLWINILQEACHEIRVLSAYEYVFPIDEGYNPLRRDDSDDGDDGLSDDDGSSGAA